MCRNRCSGKPPLAALAIPHSLGGQRWIPASSRGQHTDHRRDGLNQQAESDNQQRKTCAGRVDVGLEPGFICHTVSVEQTVSIEFRLITFTTVMGSH